MNTATSEVRVLSELTVWFKDRLDQADLHWDDEPLSYDGNTQYDVLFYRLQTEAAQYWQAKYGFQPTPGQLMKGFFGAEFERARQQRLARRGWKEKFHDWCSGPKLPRKPNVRGILKA
jgi:hypothetical protein